MVARMVAQMEVVMARMVAQTMVAGTKIKT